MATLHAAGLTMLRQEGIPSIRAGLDAVMRDITSLLAMARRQPERHPS
jgi:hypothetical protein